MKTLVAALLTVSPLTVAASGPASGPAEAPCPADLQATCYTGQDANGAYYTIAMPEHWNGTLIMHAHGGPDLGPPELARTTDDLTRWSVMVKEGYAWAGTSYRRGGYGTRMAVADTENLRRLVLDRFGRPERTIIHGQSWGGDVAAKTVELHGKEYDGALFTSGVLAGGSRGYDYRVDLRVVYQYYCHNHPRASEPQYPLWMGLRPGSTMTASGLRARLQECTGIESPPAERTALQQQNLHNILAVTRIPERTLSSHLSFATFTFRDIVSNRLGGRNPFTNVGVQYQGSTNDRALNRGVERFRADPAAVRDLSYDSDLTGEIGIPVLTVHAIDDPTAFVEHESAYAASVRGAGRSVNLVQTFTHESEHSALSDSEYATAVEALSAWIRTDRRPTPQGLAGNCGTHDATYKTGCFFDPSFKPSPYAERVEPRSGSRHWPVVTGKQLRNWEGQGVTGIAP